MLAFVGASAVPGRCRQGRRARGALRVRLRSSPSLTPQPPRDLGTVLVAAVKDLTDALEAGELRLQINILLPGLNTKMENAYPFNEELLFFAARALATSSALSERTLAMLYGSTGTAASADQYYRRSGNPVADGVRLASILPGDVVEGGDGCAYILVNPRNRTGNPVIVNVMDMVEKAPHAVFVLLNPLLGQTEGNIVNSIGENDRRRAFIESFREVYHLRPLYQVRRPSMATKEIGLVLKRLHNPWTVFVGSGVDMRLSEEFEDPPTRAQVSSAIEREARSASKAADPVALQAQKAEELQFLTVLGGLAIGLAGAAWFVLVRNPPM